MAPVAPVAPMEPITPCGPVAAVVPHLLDEPRDGPRQRVGPTKSARIHVPRSRASRTLDHSHRMAARALACRRQTPEDMRRDPEAGVALRTPRSFIANDHSSR